MPPDPDLRALDHLLSQEPLPFIAFALRARTLRVLAPVAGGHLIERNGRREACLVRFVRRRPRLSELALGLGESLLRLRQKERVPVHAVVWDLCGGDRGPVVQPRAFYLGEEESLSSTRVAYLRVNLRRLTAAQLLDRGTPVLFPLVPVTRDGAAGEAVRWAAAAISGRAELAPPQRADLLAALRLLAEGEGVPAALLRSCIPGDQLAGSPFYRALTGELRQALLALATDDPARLAAWLEEALMSLNAAAAMRLLETMRRRP
jgi:hypothetical protein